MSSSGDEEVIAAPRPKPARKYGRETVPPYYQYDPARKEWYKKKYAIRKQEREQRELDKIGRPPFFGIHPAPDSEPLYKTGRKHKLQFYKKPIGPQRPWSQGSETDTDDIDWSTTSEEERPLSPAMRDVRILPENRGRPIAREVIMISDEDPRPNRGFLTSSDDDDSGDLYVATPQEVITVSDEDPRPDRGFLPSEDEEPPQPPDPPVYHVGPPVPRTPSPPQSPEPPRRHRETPAELQARMQSFIDFRNRVHPEEIDEDEEETRRHKDYSKYLSSDESHMRHRNAQWDRLGFLRRPRPLRTQRLRREVSRR
jgi:hypothetical protein